MFFLQEYKALSFMAIRPRTVSTRCVQAVEGLPHPAAYAFKGRDFTVMSGTFRNGMREKVYPTKSRAMPAGSFIALPPGTPHFVSMDEQTVVQLNNIGPWVLTYIDPKDDPRQKPK